MTETLEMIEILHQNKINVRKFNYFKNKQNKKEQLENYITISIISCLFFFGIMYLLAIVENLPF